MGGVDFQYIDASMWFKNMDIILNYFKNMTSHNVVYSTPSCYLEAVRQNKDVQYPIKKDDFFPMPWRGKADTGRDTSPPDPLLSVSFASLQRTSGSQTTGRLSGQKSQKVITMKRAVAVAQHHDAVTGTAKAA
ncbi:Alpha-mannosidase, partial [Caligus rogercresseyi]